MVSIAYPTKNNYRRFKFQDGMDVRFSSKASGKSIYSVLKTNAKTNAINSNEIIVTNKANVFLVKQSYIRLLAGYIFSTNDPQTI